MDDLREVVRVFPQVGRPDDVDDLFRRCAASPALVNSGPRSGSLTHLPSTPALAPPLAY
jgi:hypothetical protein